MVAAVVGGMVASGVIKVVLKQLGSAIVGKIKLYKNLTKDLEKMKMTLESVEAVLSDAERRSITDSSALLWVNRLKAAMYDISDMLEDFGSDNKNLVCNIPSIWLPSIWIGMWLFFRIVEKRSLCGAQLSIGNLANVVL